MAPVTLTRVPIEIERWQVPGPENLERYDLDENWGEGAVIRYRHGPKSIYYRFYEWNLFGAVHEGLHTQADKNQRVQARWMETSGVIEYPDHGVALTLELAGDGVDMTLTVENQSGHDWPALAALVPCLSPGRVRDDPKDPTLADAAHTRTYYHGQSGLEPLDDREIYWHEEYDDHVQQQRPDDGFPWDHKWPTAPDTMAESLLVRESTDGRWAMGIAWEDALSAQGHNPWWCMHLSAAVGPLDIGETRARSGKLYLLEGDAGQVVERYKQDFH